MPDLLQILGALLVLTGFAAAQFGRLSPRSRPYLVVNLLGSAVLAGLALHSGDWGFLLLEGVWAVVSAVGLLRSLTRPAAAPRSARH